MGVLRLLLVHLALLSSVGWANLVLNVEHKFKGRERSLPDFMAHDARRHLSAFDVSLGGTALPSQTGLYYTNLGLGSPAQHFYVQVDTGSDLFWVNCVGHCNNCPTKSGFGMDLTLYDPKKSKTSKVIPCDHEFCTSTAISQFGSCNSGYSCPYTLKYGDGSTASGQFVKDNLLLQKVSRNLNITLMTEPVIFGCGDRRLEKQEEASDDVLDGILGLGKANTSLVSQLAAAGKAKKMFAHCLDTKTGGGVFTIGEVVHPETSTIPLIPNRTHYYVTLKSIEVGGQALQIPSNSSDDDGNGKGWEAILDTGTTLAYLSEDIYHPLMKKITDKNGMMRLSATEDSFGCFVYEGLSLSISEKFPAIKLHFDNSLTLTVSPADYLFPLRDSILCSGWLSTKRKADNGKPMILLGDMVLANKLVTYDLENQAVGWTDYDCTANTTRVKDGNGAVYAVSYHNITSGADKTTTNASLLLLLSILMLFNFYITAN